MGPTNSLIVASGGTLLVNDNSGTAGSGKSVMISGTGVNSTNPAGPQGALRGADSIFSTWAGNVVASGPAYIAAGSDGVFTLTGSISLA